MRPQAAHLWEDASLEDALAEAAESRIARLVIPAHHLRAPTALE